jgi:hypothetical protein
MSIQVRKLVTFVERTEREMDQTLSAPAVRGWSAAVIANPYAGAFHADLSELIDAGEDLGGLLAAKCLAALGVGADAVQGFGKGAIVGENGEIEHAAALLHPRLGAPLRAVLGGGKALVPSSKKMGGVDVTLDIPLGHKDAAYVRTHFDAMEVRVADAPKADEILVAIALSLGGRPLARVGGLTHDQVVGADGLR